MKNAGKDRVAPRSNVWLLVAGLGVVFVGLAFAGIQIAQSDNPVSEEKQEFLDRLANPPTLDPSLVPSSTARPGLYTLGPTTAPRPDGLYEFGQAPFAFQLFAFENQWQGHVDGVLTIVYAGKLGHGTKNPGRGIVIVDRRPAAGLSEFEAPAGIGSLHITGYDGFVLEIQSGDGQAFRLDVETLEFSYESGTTIPALTVRPSEAALPTPNGTLPFESPSSVPAPTLGE